MTGEKIPANEVAGLSTAGRPLLVRYDLQELSKALTKDQLLSRVQGMWRYKEFLPVRDCNNIVSLGEMTSPIISAPEMTRRLGGGEIWIKDEGRLPTGSFKSRGISVAVSMAKEFGIERMVIPTAGNAGAALAAYCARAAIDCHVFCPDDAPEVTISEIGLFTDHVWRVNGIITDLGPIIKAGAKEMGWFDVSTLKEPYRVEGKKTMGLELAEQFAWELPDSIFYPTGGGTGLIGMWKAFDELEAMGWIGSKRPRMVAVQSSTCAPIVRAFDEGSEYARPWEGGTTSIPGVRVPSTIGDQLILRVLRQSHGFAIGIDDSEVEDARYELAKSDGIHLCPEGAATLVAYRRALQEGRVSRSESAVLFNCATGLKYPMRSVTRTLDRHVHIDFTSL